MRRLPISDTLVETVRMVTNTHINPLGVVHGGHVLRWMVTAASMSAMRTARSPALLAHMDNVFFINPIRLGMNAVVTAWVDYIGRSSMEITVLVEEENPFSGQRRLTTAAHMTYVAVSEDLRPRPVGACIEPRGPREEELYKRALARRRSRARRRPVAGLRPLVQGFTLDTHFLVNPEDTLAYNAMHAGRLLHVMDETAGILGMRYARGVVVTAAIDATDFVAPIIVGDIVRVSAVLTYVGRTSLEIGLVVSTYNPLSGSEKVNASSFFTMVHLSREGRPAPVPRPRELPPWAREAEAEALERRRRRMEMLQFFRREAEKIKPPVARGQD